MTIEGRLPAASLLRRALGRYFRRAQNLVLFRLGRQVRVDENLEHSLTNALPRVVYLRLSEGYSLKHLSLGPEHPWVRALKIAVHARPAARHRQCESLIRDSFRQAPTSLPDFLGLKDAPDWLHHIPPAQDFFPWDRLEPDNVFRYRCGYWSHNITNHRPTSHSWPGFGPQSHSTCARHAKRLLKLHRNIQRRGLKTNSAPDGLPEAIVLFKSAEDLRWIVTNGNHRVAVASSLGFAKIPVRVTSVVRYDEIARWPAVQSKIYSEAQARSVFNGYFSTAEFIQG